MKGRFNIVMLLSVHVERMNPKGLVPVAFLIAVLFVFAAGAGAVSKPSAAELAAITERGRFLAEYDAAAWHATDAVIATHPKANPSGRYIAHKTVAGWVVDFGRLNASEDKFLVAYEAIQAGGQYTIKSFDHARVDTGWNLAASKGIETATKDFGRTDRPYNVAVLPAAQGSMYVYLYPAQVKTGVYPLGGDVRYRIAPDGMKVLEKRQMHKSIIETAPSSSADRVAGGYHVHVLSDLPEDTDVLFVLTRKPRVPEIVIAGPYMYTIDVRGAITAENRPKP
jgi:hypothetical protein